MPRWWLYPQSLLDEGPCQLPSRILNTCFWVQLKATYQAQRRDLDLSQPHQTHSWASESLPENPSLLSHSKCFQIPTQCQAASQLLNHRELCAICC